MLDERAVKACVRDVMVRRRNREAAVCAGSLEGAYQVACMAGAAERSTRSSACHAEMLQHRRAGRDAWRAQHSTALPWWLGLAHSVLRAASAVCSAMAATSGAARPAMAASRALPARERVGKKQSRRGWPSCWHDGCSHPATWPGRVAAPGIIQRHIGSVCHPVQVLPSPQVAVMAGSMKPPMPCTRKGSLSSGR